jgi:hypothetical protein
MAFTVIIKRGRTSGTPRHAPWLWSRTLTTNIG